MQTVYQTISIRPRWKAAPAEEKIIDLARYRKKLEGTEQPEEPKPEPPKDSREKRWGLLWDAVASLGVVAMVVIFCLELLG